MLACHIERGSECCKFWRFGKVQIRVGEDRCLIINSLDVVGVDGQEQRLAAEMRTRETELLELEKSCLSWNGKLTLSKASSGTGLKEICTLKGGVSNTRHTIIESEIGISWHYELDVVRHANDVDTKVERYSRCIIINARAIVHGTCMCNIILHY